MSFKKEKRDSIKKYMLEKIADNDPSMITKTVDAFGITPNTVYRYVRELISEGVIVKSGRQLTLNKKSVYYILSLADIAPDSEDKVFEKYLEPYIKNYPENILHIWYYCFTEMVNNVLDHSKADQLSIFISQDYMNTSVILNDDGVGIFYKIQSYYNYPSVDDAIIELFKGKLTTDKEHHSGEGIFFTSRIMDVFAAISSGKVFSHTEFHELLNDLSEYPGLKDSDKYKNGTTIMMKLSNHTQKTTREIMDKYANVEGGFIRTTIPIKNIYPTYPVSRSQAKRLAHRFEDFQEVELDFSGVSEIGQGFAHELFVVFKKQHPEVVLIPTNANSNIQRMIYHVSN